METGRSHHVATADASKLAWLHVGLLLPKALASRVNMFVSVNDALFVGARCVDPGDHAFPNTLITSRRFFNSRNNSPPLIFAPQDEDATLVAQSLYSGLENKTAYLFVSVWRCTSCGTLTHRVSFTLSKGKLIRKFVLGFC